MVQTFWDTGSWIYVDIARVICNVSVEPKSKMQLNTAHEAAIQMNKIKQELLQAQTGILHNPNSKCIKHASIHMRTSEHKNTPACEIAIPIFLRKHYSSGWKQTKSPLIWGGGRHSNTNRRHVSTFQLMCFNFIQKSVLSK